MITTKMPIATEILGKIANHLGIKKIDSEKDIRQMYDFVHER